MFVCFHACDASQLHNWVTCIILIADQLKLYVCMMPDACALAEELIWMFTSVSHQACVQLLVMKHYCHFQNKATKQASENQSPEQETRTNIIYFITTLCFKLQEAPQGPILTSESAEGETAKQALQEQNAKAGAQVWHDVQKSCKSLQGQRWRKCATTCVNEGHYAVEEKVHMQAEGVCRQVCPFTVCE